jgi:hypothetical protein
MNTKEVADLFKSYADETDNTFLTDAQVKLYLSQGYSDFRDKVADVSPYIYNAEHLFELTTDKYDLAAAGLLGPAAVAGQKLSRVLNVARINTTADNDLIEYLQSAPSVASSNIFQYVLQGSTLHFSGYVSGAMRLEYIPFHNVDFDPAAAIGAYIDDLDSFHDMIALYAYRRYAIRDGADNTQILREIAQKEMALDSFLQSGRSHQASRFVNDYYEQWG